MEKPSLLEVFSFIYYFPSALIGPSFEFADFRKYIRLEEEYSDINYKECSNSAFKQLILGFASIFMTVYFSGKVPASYCGTEEFITLSMTYKYFYFMFSMFVVRCKYYVGWQLTQSLIMYCGLNYYTVKNKDGVIEHKFDKILSCSIWDIEFNVSTKTRIQYWNRTVHMWLKYHVFLRLIGGKKKLSHSLSSLITFMISAIWHGFYPVYYLFFFAYYMIEQVATVVEQKGLVTYIESASFIKRLVYRIFLSSFLQFFGQSFVILTLTNNFNYFRAFYFIPNILLYSMFVYFCLMKTKSKKSNLQESIPENTDTKKQD